MHFLCPHAVIHLLGCRYRLMASCFYMFVLYALSSKMLWPSNCTFIAFLCFLRLEVTWEDKKTRYTKEFCARSSRICMPSPKFLAFIASEISAFIRTDRQTDMAISTRLVILIWIYTLFKVGNASFYLLHAFRRV